MRDRGLVNLDDADQGIALGIDHRPAQFGAQQPGGLVGPQSEQLPQLYQEGELSEKGRPPRKDFVEAIESIRQARLETFWTDDPSRLPPPGQEMWWEVWCVRGLEREFEQLADRLGARIADREQRLYFPEHVVLPVLTDRATIELMLFARLSIVELRRASDSPAFFLDDMDRDEQRAVAERLAERTEWPGADVPAVCLLDTGVNRAHILIEPTLAETDMAAVRPEWGLADSPHGHGTGMAGLALFGDETDMAAVRPEWGLADSPHGHGTGMAGRRSLCSAI